MFYSEYGQDRFVSSILPHRKGVFVEFGALDGLFHSNTLFLERERGWSGLLIEANPRLYKELTRNRPDCRCMPFAIWKEHGLVEFEIAPVIGWSGVGEAFHVKHRDRINGPTERVAVQAITLEDALRFSGVTRIDYMSIDVEGAERDILSVFPFAKYDITLIGVEDNYGDPALDRLITDNGYEFLRQIGPDRFYWRCSTTRPSQITSD